MPQTYSLARVKMFLRRIREEKERAVEQVKKVKSSPEEYVNGAIVSYRTKIELCEDLLRIAELHFGSDVKEE